MTERTSAEASGAIVELGHLRRRFEELYAQPPRLFCAPGRVNLIGEHTDYNEGFVLPAAMDRFVWVAAAPRRDSLLQVCSENFSERAEFDLRERNPSPRPHWTSYIRGVALSLLSAGIEVPGANLLVEGNLPMGAGLASSAAVEVATGVALLAVAGTTLDRVALAKICQRAEHQWTGARCGIMDQLVACCGRAGSALLLDCRSLRYDFLPLLPGAQFVVCNTGVKHENAAGEYNVRRAESDAAVRALASRIAGVRALRDVSMPQLEEHRDSLPPVLFRRCRHVISENARVLEAGRALERGDAARFGRLMAESHRSLREDYEVSCAELDLLVELASGLDGVYGARMTGGGFGGCTVSLVHKDLVQDFQQAIAEGYQRGAGRRVEIYKFTASDGAREVVE